MVMKADTAQFVEMIGDQLRCPPEALADPEVSAQYLIKARNLPKSGAAPEPVPHVSEHRLNSDVAVRVYSPEGPGPLPVVIYFHGGGWVSGDLDMHDSTCRRIANRARAVVVNVDYRLAPEHRFPDAFDDAWVAVQWTHDHAAELGGDPGRLAVAGSSAGGNLAAAVALRARDERAPRIDLQVLIYPVLDSRLDTDSFRENAEGYLLTATQMEWYWNQYVPDTSDRKDWRVSPMHADSLAGLPPAIVVVAEHDPLKDEGEAYASRLQEEGVAAEVTCYEGQIHGFMGFLGFVADAEVALNATADRIARHFA
jgi:acetyl esterase